MRTRQKRWGLLAFLTMALVIGALLSFSSSAWATPAQEHAQQQSVPPIKEANMTVVCPGEDFVFEISFRAGPTDWYGVVVTDELDPNLKIDAVSTSQGIVSIVGQLVTVDVGHVPAGTTVTITITCTVRDTAPAGFRIDNTASVVAQDPALEFDPRAYIEVCGEFVPEPSSLLLLGSGLAGLAGYAGMRWSNRRRA
jgi:fimbrial isopeptide formation D2 family protein